MTSSLHVFIPSLNVQLNVLGNLCNFKMPTFFLLLLFPLDEMKRKENKHMQVSIDEGKIKLKQNLKISPTSSFNFHSSKLYFN